MGIDSSNNFEKNIEEKSLRELEKEKISLETQVKKEELKDTISQSIINKLNSKQGYKVKKNDILSIINKITTKGNHINFLKPADKIWPGDIIRIIDGKVFRTHNGNDKIVGIVSQGFKTKEIIKTTEKKVQPKEEKPASDNETTPIIKPKTTIAKVGSDTTSPNKNSNDKMNTDGDIKSNSIFTKIGYIEEGKQYIIGKDGEPKLITFDGLSPEIKNKLEKLKEQKGEIESAILLLNAYKINNPNKNINSTLKKLKKLISDLLSGTITSNNFNNELIKTLKDVFPDGRNRMGSTENNVIKLFKNKKGEDLRLGVLNYIRDDFDAYKLTASNILEKNFNQSKIDNKFINKISNELLTNNTGNIKIEIENNKLLIKYLKENGTSVDDFIDKILDLQQKLIEKKKNINISNLAKKAGMTSKNYKKLLNKIMINKGVKILIFNQFMDSITDNRGKVKNPTSFQNSDELNLYSDIEGFGIWNLSDSNASIAGLILETAVMEIAALGVGMVTAGAGEVAINTLIAARWAKRGTEVIEDVSRLNRVEKLLETVKIGDNIYKTSKAGKISYIVGKTTLSGALFYEGTNAIQNVFEKRNIFDGAGNMKEIGKSILFMGAMEGLGKLFKEVPGLKKIYDTEKSGKIGKILKLSGQTTVEGISLGAIGGFINVTFDGGEWTTQDFVEGIIMALMFKLMGKGRDFSIRKINGKIEVSKKTENISNSSSTEYYQGKKYKYKFENGKWYNIDTGKELKNKPKNIEKIETPTGKEVEKNIHKLFIKEFDDFFPKKFFGKHKSKTLILENKAGEKIEIKRWTDGKFSIKGEEEKIYSRKEILQKIQNDYPEYENNFIKEKARTKYNEIKNSKEKFVTNRGWNLRENEKITERGLEVKEGGKFRPATQKEINDFLNNNKKIEKLLNESLEQKIKTDIKDNGLKEALLKNKGALIKDIFLGKKYFNLWFPALITIGELHDKKDINLSMFLKEFSIAYLSSAAFMLSFGGLKLIFTSKPIQIAKNFIGKHWGKMLIIPAGIYGGYRTYIYKEHTK